MFWFISQYRCFSPYSVFQTATPESKRIQNEKEKKRKALVRLCCVGTRRFFNLFSRFFPQLKEASRQTGDDFPAAFASDTPCVALLVLSSLCVSHSVQCACAHLRRRRFGARLCWRWRFVRRRLADGRHGRYAEERPRVQNVTD